MIHTWKMSVYGFIPQSNVYSYAIEQYFKQSDSQWLINFYTEENSIFKLVSVNWEILLKDLYQRVDFNLSEPE